MSHIFIAEHFLERSQIKITSTEQYLLGSLAPDAIHFREDYNRNQKRTTHLYMNLDKTNTENFVNNWKNNVDDFFQSHNSNELFDFLLGYCIHIMADIYNYKYIWTPFKLTYLNDNEAIYQNECLSIDSEIFQKKDYGIRIFPLIERSKEFDFLGILSKNELARLKNNIVNIQYKNERIVDSSKNKFISYNQW